jgi:hypothetical protein
MQMYDSLCSEKKKTGGSFAYTLVPQKRSERVKIVNFERKKWLKTIPLSNLTTLIVTYAR